MASPVREAAQQAFLASRNDAALQALGEVLDPFDVSVMTEVHYEPVGGMSLFVFTDGDLHFAVRGNPAGWTVTLVHDVDGAWTEIGEVESLVQLATLPLPPEPEPEPETPAVAPWTAQEAVAVGDVRSYQGADYEVVQAHTTQVGWEPPNVPALWVLA